MSKKQQKAMLDLHRLMEAANLKTEEDYERFAREMTGKTIPSFEKEALSAEEQAQDLVYEAAETEDALQADKLIFQAFALDPDCVEAFEYLAEVAGSPMLSLMFFKNGFSAARKKLGEPYFKKNKGRFWGLVETRPYMRCLQGYADVLYLLGQAPAALEVYFEMLALNPNDNQGVRDQAGLYCLQLNKLDEFEKLATDYADDFTAFFHYNRVLFSFLKEGDSETTRSFFAEAKKRNKHVPQLLVSRKQLPPLGDAYSLGEKTEAVYYATFARDIWQSKIGSISWLEKMYRKQ
jgi:tetratricopeptide (TPR) repeat protein